MPRCSLKLPFTTLMWIMNMDYNIKDKMTKNIELEIPHSPPLSLFPSQLCSPLKSLTDLDFLNSKI